MTTVCVHRTHADPESSLPILEGEGEGTSQLGHGKAQDVSYPQHHTPAGDSEQVGPHLAFLRFAVSDVPLKTPEVPGNAGAAGAQRECLLHFYLALCPHPFCTFPLRVSLSYKLYLQENANLSKC